MFFFGFHNTVSIHVITRFRRLLSMTTLVLPGPARAVLIQQLIKTCAVALAVLYLITEGTIVSGSDIFNLTKPLTMMTHLLRRKIPEMFVKKANVNVFFEFSNYALNVIK